MTQNKDNQPSEYHVASFVAYCTLARVDEVKQAILAYEGTEIHATSDAGKIVFTIEGDTHKGIGKTMDLLGVHTGIINLSPVYHQVLDEEQENKLA